MQHDVRRTIDGLTGYEVLTCYSSFCGGTYRQVYPPHSALNVQNRQDFLADHPCDNIQPRIESSL